MRQLMISIIWLVLNALIPFFYTVPLGWFAGDTAIGLYVHLFTMGLLLAFGTFIFHYFLFERLAVFFHLRNAKPLLWIGASILLLVVYTIKISTVTSWSVGHIVAIGSIPVFLSSIWVVLGLPIKSKYSSY